MRGVLPPTDWTRVMVLAPHPDDETLASFLGYPDQVSAVLYSGWIPASAGMTGASLPRRREPSPHKQAASYWKSSPSRATDQASSLPPMLPEEQRS